MQGPAKVQYLFLKYNNQMLYLNMKVNNSCSIFALFLLTEERADLLGAKATN